MRHAPRAAFTRKTEDHRPRLLPAFWHGQPLQRVVMADGAALARLAAAPGGLRRIALPAGAAAQAGFLKRWAARTAAGLAGAVLVLPFAAMAQGSEFVAAGKIAEVETVTLQADGSARLDLANGRTVTVPAAEVQVTAAGEVMVAAPVAEAVAAAAQAVALAGAGAAALGGLAALGAAGGGGSGGGDIIGGGDDGDGDGGDGGDGGGHVPQMIPVVDGYIANALVFRDTDGDGVHDVGEASTTTDEFGEFDVALLTGTGRLVSQGGIDIATGQEFRGSLTAPEGATVITPLTTLVQALIEASPEGETPPTAEAAAATIGTKLGLTGDANNLLTLDPVARADGADGQAADAAALAKAAQIANTLIVAQAAGADTAKVAQKLAQELAGAEDGQGAARLSNSAVLQAALEEGLEDDSNAAALAVLVADANTAVGDGTGDAETATAAIEAAQTKAAAMADQVSESVESGGETELPTDFETVVAPAPLTPVGIEFDEVINAAVAAGDVIVSGTGRIGTEVTVGLGGASKTATVAENGTWSVTFAGSDFAADGSFEMTVRATDDSGETPVSSRIIRRDVTIDRVAEAPGVTLVDDTGASATDRITADGTLSVSTETDAEVEYSTAGTAWADTFTPVEGQNIVQVRQVDAAGNISDPTEFSFVLDTIAPEALASPVLQVDTGVDGDNVTSDARLALAPEPGATEQYRINGGDWSATYAPVEGENSVEVRQLDAAGNPSTESEPLVFTLDTQIAAPVIGIVATDGVINAAEAEGGVIIAGDAEAGASVAVSFAGQQRTVAAGQNGQWQADFGSLSELSPQGVLTITATATDLAGNIAGPVSSQVTVDTVAPVVSAVLAGDDIVTLAEAAGGMALASGTAEAGSAISVTLGSGEAATTTANPGGNWSVSVALPETGTAHSLAVTARDPAGNVATTEVPVTIQRLATVTVAGDEDHPELTDLPYLVGRTLFEDGQIVGDPGETGITLRSEDGTLEVAVLGEGVIWGADEEGEPVPLSGLFTGMIFREVAGAEVLRIEGLSISAPALNAAVDADWDDPDLPAFWALFSPYAFHVTGGDGPDEPWLGPLADGAESYALGAGYDYIRASAGTSGRVRATTRSTAAPTAIFTIRSTIIHSA